MKEKLNKLNFSKIKNTCSMKDIIKRIKVLQKIFAKHISDEGLLSKNYEELLNSTVTKQKQIIKNGQKI